MSGAVDPAATIRLEWSLALEAPRPRVFAALTEARHLERWFCDEAACEPGEGGAIELRWRRPGSSAEPFRGRWVAWSPPERVAYRGGHPGYPDGDSGRVEYALAEVGGATRLDVVHELPARSDYEPIAARYRDVWPRTLARLVSYLTPEGA